MRARLLAAAVVAAAFTASPAVAATVYQPVNVTLDVSIFEDRINHAACALSVPRKAKVGYPNGFANGFDVLEAAVKAGCIDSYDSFDSGAYGRYLTCIDEFCGQDAPTWAIPAPTAYAGTWWTFTVNNEFSNEGLDSYNVVNGKEIGLTYSTYACESVTFKCIY